MHRFAVINKYFCEMRVDIITRSIKRFLNIQGNDLCIVWGIVSCYPVHIQKNIF